MKRSKGRIYLSAFLAVVILVFGYVGWRLGTAKSVTNSVKNAYLKTLSCEIYFHSSSLANS